MSGDGGRRTVESGSPGSIAPLGEPSSAPAGAPDPSASVLEAQMALAESRLFGAGPVRIGRFEVEEILGSGASATVFGARDALLRRRVALKVWSQRSPTAPEVGGCVDLEGASERFLREAQAMASLTHPNIVAIYDVGSWNGRPFIAMELIEGSTLGAYLAAPGRTRDDVLRAFAQAGRGLAAAHQRGHVHRDFKPSNVLVARDGRVVVSDFGLVGRATLARGTQPGAGLPGTHPAGTPAYAAPEQRRGVAAHPSADVYSFALTLVECLLGEHPQPERDGTWQPRLRRLVPAVLYAELVRALELDPARRSVALDPLLAAFARVRHGRARWLGGSVGIAALGAAALWWTTRADSTAAPGSEPLIGLTPAGYHDEAVALSATPPAQRGAQWRARVRQLLLQPLPARVECRWPRPQTLYANDVALLEHHAIVVDPRGRAALACELATGAVTEVAAHVRAVLGFQANAVWLESSDGTIVALRERGPRSLQAVDRSTAQATLDVRLGSTTWTVAAAVPGDWRGRAGFEISASGALDYAPIGRPRRRLSSRCRKLAVNASSTLGLVVEQSPSGEDVVTVLALPQGRPLAAATLSGDELDSIEISHDGSSAVVTTVEGAVWWWSSQTGQWQRQESGSGKMLARLSPSGRRALLLPHSDASLAIREVRSGREYVLANPKAGIVAARFSSDDELIAVDSSSRVWRWRLEDQRASVLARHEKTDGKSAWGFSMLGDEAAVATSTSTARAPQVIVSPLGDGDARTLPVSEAAPRRCLHDRRQGVGVHGLAARGDSLWAGTTGGDLLRWRWASGELVERTRVTCARWLWSVRAPSEFVERDLVLVGAGLGLEHPRSGGRVFAVERGEVSEVLAAGAQGNTGIGDIAIAPGGAVAVAVASDGALVGFEPRSRRVLYRRVATAVGEVRKAVFLDADRVLTGADDGTVRLWRAADGAELAALEMPPASGSVYALASAAGQGFAATASGALVRLALPPSRSASAFYAGHRAAILALSVDPSGTWLLSGDEMGRVCLHDTAASECHTWLDGYPPRAEVRHVRLLRDGTALAFADDGVLRRWRPLYDESAAMLGAELERRAGLARR